MMLNLRQLRESYLHANLPDAVRLQMVTQWSAINIQVELIDNNKQY